jgi:2-oxoglutarate ferredoxin oxidoreductase subunit alpha
MVAHTREAVSLPGPEAMDVVDRVKPSVPPEWHIPYDDTVQGVPPMADFGTGYRYHVTGLAHDIRGFPTQRPEEVEAFTKRLFRKITLGFHEIQMTRTFHMEDAEVAVIAYGSVARSAWRAVVEAREQGLRAGLIQLVTLFPFPRHAVEKALLQCRAVLVPEMNIGQISREVKRVNPAAADVEKLNRIDGQFITPMEILEKLKSIG